MKTFYPIDLVFIDKNILSLSKSFRNIHFELLSNISQEIREAYETFHSQYPEGNITREDYISSTKVG